MIVALPTFGESVRGSRHLRRKARRLRRDLKLLITFVAIRCRDCHPDADKELLSLKTHNVSALSSREVRLCGECSRLLGHALVKRAHCPYDPKPMCKKCPTHCYSRQHRAEMREVMRYSGRKLVMSGRLDYLYHLLF
jgi:hypothetical protein